MSIIFDILFFDCYNKCNIYITWSIMKNKKLKELRKSKGYSQATLAAEIGVTRQTINLIEAGNYNPTLKLCLDICYVLDVTLDQIFWKEQDE